LEFYTRELHSHQDRFIPLGKDRPLSTSASESADPDPLADDDRLMIRLQEGDRSAFDLLFEKYQHALVGFFVRSTRDRELSQDLAHETWIKLLNNFWDYIPSGRFRGWLFRIAHNLMIDDVRRRSGDALLRSYTGRADDEDDGIGRLAGEILPPTQAIESNEVTAVVDQALDEIPEDQRLTFILHIYCDLPINEVATIMEVSPATSKSRLRLAREKLSEKLQLRGIGPTTT